MVTALIESIERWLEANRPVYYSRLQPGVDDSILDAFETQFSIQLPQAFRELYRWRNGQDPMSSESLYDNRMYLALEEVASTKAMLDEMIESDFEDPRYWRLGWVPFLHNGGGSYLCMDLSAEDGGNTGQLIGFWKQDEDRPVEFKSVESWLTYLVESMESGTIQIL